MFWDQQIPCQGAGYLGTNEGCRQSGDGRNHLRRAWRVQSAMHGDRRRPRSARISTGYGQRVQQATWSSPMTQRLLLEAGFGTYWSQWGGTDIPAATSRSSWA